MNEFEKPEPSFLDPEGPDPGDTLTDTGTSTRPFRLPFLRAIWEGNTPLGVLAFGLIAAAIYLLTRKSGASPFNNHSWQAEAFLHGRIDIPDAPGFLDWVMYQGKKYSHQGPLTAVLTMPFVALFGVNFNMGYLAVILGATCAATAYSIATRIGLRAKARLMAWIFPVLGTTIWYEAKEGTTWSTAALASVLFLLLALNEYFGDRRPFHIGLLVGLAGLCRPPAFLALAGFAFALQGSQTRKLDQRLLHLGLGVAGPFLVMLGFNLARFGSLADKSIELFYYADPYHYQAAHGVISIKYLPSNLYSWLFLPPAFTSSFPFLRPMLVGTSLTLTSPAFVVAFASKHERRLWLCCLVLVPAGLVYVNGFAQFGMRYLLDAIPFIFALICLAIRDGRAHIYLPLLIFSVAMNAFGVFYTNANSLLP